MTICFTTVVWKRYFRKISTGTMMQDMAIKRDHSFIVKGTVRCRCDDNTKWNNKKRKKKTEERSPEIGKFLKRKNENSETKKARKKEKHHSKKRKLTRTDPPKQVNKIWHKKIMGMMHIKPLFLVRLVVTLHSEVRTLNALKVQRKIKKEKKAVRNTGPPCLLRSEWDSSLACGLLWSSPGKSATRSNKA